MNASIIRTIAFKDLKEVRQNRSAWAPAIILPLVFMIILPLAIILAPDAFAMSELNTAQNPITLMKSNSPVLAAQLVGLNDKQSWVVVMIGSALAPFFLILPLMFSTIVGADSFAGEKERKTLEALLYTPATDGELFLGKVIASVAPAIALAWFSFVVYTLVVNVAGFPVMGRIWFPTAPWWPLMLWVTPAIATLGMGLTVLISSRVSTFMEAYQLSASLVVLVLALIVGQLTGVLYLNVEVALLVGLIIWIADAVIIRYAVRSFARATLLARL